MPCRAKGQAQLFLLRAKAILAQGTVQFQSRDKNRQFLVSTGLRRRHQIDVLESLTPEDYFSTIEANEDSSHEAWEFGRRYGDTELYIKLAILVGRDDEVLLCVSFHEAEQPIIYPYRD